MNCSVVSSRVNAEILDGSVIRENLSSHTDGNNGNETGGNYCSYYRKLGHLRQNCFEFKKKETDTAIIKPVTIITVTVT
jgi:hypothetical protein